MPQLKDRLPENRFIALFVGKSGTGKTVAGCSFPKPLHADDFDGRIGGAQDLSFQDTEGIDYTYFPPKQPALISSINKHLELYLTNAMLLTKSMNSGIDFPKTWLLGSLTNATFAFRAQAMSLTHADGKGRVLGGVSLSGPEDYKLEAQVTYDYIAFLKSLPLQNVILDAHIVDRYGKSNPDDKYSESVVIGEKLSITDKLGENVQTHFDHIFKFEREADSRSERFFVWFRGGIARSSYSWLPLGRHEWTGRNFYEFMMGFKQEKK